MSKVCSRLSGSAGVRGFLADQYAHEIISRNGTEVEGGRRYFCAVYDSETKIITWGLSYMASSEKCDVYARSGTFCCRCREAMPGHNLPIEVRQSLASKK